MESLGEKISPILVEIENTLWESEANMPNRKHWFTKDGFRAAAKICMATLMDKMWELQEKENMPIEQRAEMAVTAGNEFRQLIKKYTDIDTHDLYKKS